MPVWKKENPKMQHKFKSRENHKKNTEKQVTFVVLYNATQV